MMISAESAERISLLYEVAKRHGSAITLRDLVLLLPEPSTEGELAQAFCSSPALASKFELRSGYVTLRSEEEKEFLLDAHLEGRRTALRNLSHAAKFVPFLRSASFRLVSVSGSTSYLSASRSPDLDLFCVAHPRRLWSSLTTALLLARVFRLTHPEAPSICFSCVMDVEYAESVFTESRDPLFARDALSAIVIQGNDTYQSLMKKATWIQSLYPVAYSEMVGEVCQDRLPNPKHEDVAQVLDRLLYIFVGSYIRIKSFLLNRRIAKAQRSEGVFKLRTSPNHLIYESRRYVSLRDSYGSIRKE